MVSPFRAYAPPAVEYEIALAPVLSALVSLALLTTDLDANAEEEWLSDTASRLSAEQRLHNRLAFEVFGAALVPAQEYPDFPAYLAALEATPPEQLRARARAGAIDADAWLARLAPDPALQPEARALLADPPALKTLLVSHLRALWEALLAPVWQRRLSQLHGFQLFLQQREFPTTTAGDLLRGLLNRELPDWLAIQLGGVRKVMFVLQPHVRLFASRFGSPDTLWMFARPSPENLAVRSAPIKRAELVRPLAALADESRLHILELLAQGDLPTQEIIAQLGQSQPNVSRHLKQLVSAGFVDELRGEGANKRYRLLPRQLDRLGWMVRQLLQQATAAPGPGDARAALPPALRRFVDARGRLSAWPARREDRVLVLGYLASKFEPGREYAEKEVNAIINQWQIYQDHATLRRELFSQHFLGRTPDGARYWLLERPADAEYVA